MNTNDLKSLPKIEVSFQNDFSGTEREEILTPKFVLDELRKMGITPSIGQKILLWEYDPADGNNYLCATGVIANSNNPTSPLIDGVAVKIKIDQKKFFRIKEIW